MRQIYNSMSIESKRMLSIKEAAAYIGQGETKARIWLKEIGALRKIGKRALYDKVVINAVLDAFIDSPTQRGA